MKTKFTFLLALVMTMGIFLQTAKAISPITVSGSNGANGSYASLTKADGAFAALNSVTQAGMTITITITGDVIDEDGTTPLTGTLGMWTTLTIYPSGTRTISGSVGTPLIDLNGADNVTIDGLNSGGNSLTISNTSVSATAGTSTIRFINDATNNSVIKCTVLGSATVPLATGGGNIFVSTGTTSGNDNITVSNCKIGPAGTNLPSKGIFGSGTTSDATVANSTITISNCEIYDFFLGGGCAGVYALTGNTEWSVTDNKLYQSASRAMTGIMTGIYFVNTTYGNNIQITGNTIGFANNAGTGTLTLTGTGSFRGIYHSAAVKDANACNINNNTISDISLTSSTGTCSGIENNSAGLANTININNNNIKNFALTTTTGAFFGISWGNANNMTITSNNVHDLTSNGAGPIYGIYSGSNSVNENVSNNNVYNLTLTAAVSSTIRGIYQSTKTGAKTFQNNTIYGLSGLGGTTITGIYLSYATTADISGNVVYSLTSTGGTGGIVSGIYSSASSVTTVNIYKNKIYGLTSSSTGPTLNGIYIKAGPTHNVYNNFISDLTTTAAISAMPLVGIYIIGGTTSNVFYNTVYLNSSSSGSLFGSSAIYASTATTVNMQNNILVNKSTPKGAGITTAYSRSTTTLTSYSSNSNANCFYAGSVEDAAHAVYYDGTSTYTMSAYKTLVGPTRDAVSFRELPPFINVTATPYDLHLSAGTATQCKRGGIPITSPITITSDFDGETRGVTPDIGADEAYSKLWNGSTSIDWNNTANWSPSGVPSATDHIYIPAGTTFNPTVNLAVAAPATCNNLKIASGTTLTIPPNKGLTVNGFLTNLAGMGGLIIQSDASGTGSLKILGSTSASATVERNLSIEKWHLLSSPTASQPIINFLTNNLDIATSALATASHYEYAMSSYTAGSWPSFFPHDKSDLDLFAVGKGYRVLTSSPFIKTIYFEGALNSLPISAVPVETGWNLVGNPYTTALNINVGTTGFVSVNSGLLPASYAAVYFWDAATNVYVAVNNDNADTNAAVGQGFFVNASSAETITFNSDMQVHDGSNVFKASSLPRPTINLMTNNGTGNASTLIKFMDGAREGLDVGYDAGIFKADLDFSVYTKLVEDNGFEFQLQYLPINQYDHLVIPIGIDSKDGGEVFFTVETVQLDPTCKVILEDKLTNTFTDLSTNSYKAMVAANSAGAGRFYLHTGDIVSGFEDQVQPDKLSAYVKGNTEIRVIGEVGNDAVATLYNGLGKVVLSKKLDSGTLNIIGLPNLSSGLYLLKIYNNGTPQTIKVMVRK